MATLFLIIIYITFISLGLPDSLLGSAWPVMRLDIGAPLDTAGIIAIIISAGTVIASLLCNKLITKFGTGRVTLVSVAATAVALLGFSAGQNVAWLVVMAIPLGLGAGAVDAALNNYVALHYKAHHMNWLHCFWGVGAFIGPLIMGRFIRQNNNWQGGYSTISIIQFCVAALLLFTLPMWGKQNRPKAAEIPDVVTDVPARSAFKIPGVTLALGTFLLYCGTEYIVGLWGSSFLAEFRGLSASAAASALSLYYGGIAVGRLLSGFLSVKFSSKVLIRTGLFIIVCGALLLALPLPPAFAYTALALIGLGCAPVYPSMIHETPRRFGSANSQKIVGLQMAAAYCGSTFLPPLVGAVAGRTSLYILPFAALLFAALMLILSERLNIVVAQKQ
ncbi:MFS transporter [Ruminococcaceae bacterium OttesenSCG-928-A16]|nr:MFS transporter [Ruminococcaceae bacterium OttesenSCG-928-A16]